MNTTVKRILGVCFLFGIFWIAAFHSIFDAVALSLCAGGVVWILFDQRITDLKTRLTIMKNGENRIHESVEALYRGETIFQESVAGLGQQLESLHESIDALHERVDKMHRRVDYQSEWCQSLQDMTGVQHRNQNTAFVEGEK